MIVSTIFLVSCDTERKPSKRVLCKGVGSTLSYCDRLDEPNIVMARERAPYLQVRMVQSLFGSQTLLGVSNQQSTDQVLGSGRNSVELR